MHALIHICICMYVCVLYIYIYMVPESSFTGGAFRGGEDTADWDTVGSNRSIEDCLSNFDKGISSKSSNRQIWAPRGFPTVSSPLPKLGIVYDRLHRHSGASIAEQGILKGRRATYHPQFHMACASDVESIASGAWCHAGIHIIIVYIIIITIIM